MSEHLRFLTGLGCSQSFMEVMQLPRPPWNASSENRCSQIETEMLREDLGAQLKLYAQPSVSLIDGGDVLAGYNAHLPPDIEERFSLNLRLGATALSDGRLQGRYASALCAASGFLANGVTVWAKGAFHIHLPDGRLRHLAAVVHLLTHAVAVMEDFIPNYRDLRAPETLSPKDKDQLAVRSLQNAYKVANQEPLLFGDAKATTQLINTIVDRAERARPPAEKYAAQLRLPRFTYTAH